MKFSAQPEKIHIEMNNWPQTNEKENLKEKEEEGRTLCWKDRRMGLLGFVQPMTEAFPPCPS